MLPQEQKVLNCFVCPVEYHEDVYVFTLDAGMLYQKIILLAGI